MTEIIFPCMNRVNKIIGLIADNEQQRFPYENYIYEIYKTTKKVSEFG